MEANHELIAQNIVKYRLKRKLTQKALAKAINIESNSLSAVECSREKASINLLLHISRVLNINVDRLFEGNLLYEPYNFSDNIHEDLVPYVEQLKNSSIKQKEEILKILDMYIVQINKNNAVEIQV